MFFGWNKVSRGFHLASTWLVAIGVSLSALWILVANAWMQYPVGMEFDPAQMRNVMSNFLAVATSPVALNKFFHAVTSGWVLGAVFVIGVSCLITMKNKNLEMARDSVKVAGWVGVIGILLTFSTGHGSAVQVSRVQPMKLAAMEGLYRGEIGQELVGVGILDTSDPENPVKCKIAIPKMLSVLANNDPDTFVPGIDDLIDGYALTPQGDTINTVSYAERIAIGKAAQQHSATMKRPGRLTIKLECSWLKKVFGKTTASSVMDILTLLRMPCLRWPSHSIHSILWCWRAVIFCSSFSWRYSQSIRNPDGWKTAWHAGSECSPFLWYGYAARLDG